MHLDAVAKWRPFVATDGTVYELSFLDAKKITYRHQVPNRADVCYDFWVTYSCHCFSKDYPHLTDKERQALAYCAPRETRPFCPKRYTLAKTHLTTIIENLGSKAYTIKDAGYESYITTKIITDEGKEIWYHVPFKVYRENKKYRLHVMSAYPAEEQRGGGNIGFFKIAYNLHMGKALPCNPHK